MPRQNPLDRRVAMLTDKLEDRIARTQRHLTEPKPYNQVKVREEDQVRKFLQARETGGLVQLRETMGDEEVNRYVSHMSGRAQKYLNMLNERENQKDATEPSKEDLKRAPGDPVASYYTADDDLESF